MYINLALDPELLREVDELAQAEERSRRAQIRQLIRLGLIVAKADIAERRRRLAVAVGGRAR
jgi:predicted transcriptional regulator